MKEWIDERANDDLGRLGLTPETAARSAQTDALAIGREISLAFGSTDAEQSVVPALRNAASDGSIETHVPSRATILGWLGVAAFCALGEIVVGFLQVLLSDAGIALIFQALLLSLSALLAGWGLGGLFVSTLARTLPPTWRIVPQEHDGRSGDVFKLAVGCVGVLGLSWMRSVGLEGDERNVVIALTLVLALLVVVAEAFHMYCRAKYDCLWRRMFDAQVWQADERHRAAREFYQDHYRTQMERLLEGRRTRLAARGGENHVAAE
ncbi:MAG: hypothetical protein ABI895_37105 [Deltaproteobacteria bacterium]